jgi:hypothetical protein
MRVAGGADGVGGCSSIEVLNTNTLWCVRGRQAIRFIGKNWHSARFTVCPIWGILASLMSNIGRIMILVIIVGRVDEVRSIAIIPVVMVDSGEEVFILWRIGAKDFVARLGFSLSEEHSFLTFFNPKRRLAYQQCFWHQGLFLGHLVLGLHVVESFFVWM